MDTKTSDTGATVALVTPESQGDAQSSKKDPGCSPVCRPTDTCNPQDD